jgi:hypothetical protein
MTNLKVLMLQENRTAEIYASDNCQQLHEIYKGINLLTI